MRALCPPPAARGVPPQVVERPRNEQGEPPEQPCIYKEKAILTPKDALYQELIYAGFNPAWQNSVNSGRNNKQFKSFYGGSSKTGKVYSVPFRLLTFLHDQSMISLLLTCSSAVANLFVDIHNGNPIISYKHCFLAMNWLYLVRSCMSCFTLNLKYISKNQNYGHHLYLHSMTHIQSHQVDGSIAKLLLGKLSSNTHV